MDKRKKLKKTSTTKERLEEVMRETGKKQVDLVRDTGLNKSVVSRCVSGKTEPGNETIMLLARALDVSEMWLWGYDFPKARTSVQKKNDEIVSLIARLRNDPDFLDVVSALGKMPEEEYKSFKTLILPRGK